MLRIGTPRSSQISLTQGMSSNKEALSIAFMNLPQNGKGMLFIFAENWCGDVKRTRVWNLKELAERGAAYMIIEK